MAVENQGSTHVQPTLNENETIKFNVCFYRPRIGMKSAAMNHLQKINIVKICLIEGSLAYFNRFKQRLICHKCASILSGFSVEMLSFAKANKLESDGKAILECYYPWILDHVK